MSENAILYVEDLNDYFTRELVAIIEHNKSDVSAEMVTYTAGMLDRFSRSKHFYYAVEGDVRGLQSLAKKWADAVDLQPREKVVALQSVGDVSLFTLGFFVYAFDRAVVSRDYYLEMGASAYQSVAVETRHLELFDLFRALARKFEEIVHVLIEFRYTHEDELTLIEVAQRTRSPWALARLRESGISLMPQGAT